MADFRLKLKDETLRSNPEVAVWLSQCEAIINAEMETPEMRHWMYLAQTFMFEQSALYGIEVTPEMVQRYIQDNPMPLQTAQP